MGRTLTGYGVGTIADIRKDAAPLRAAPGKRRIAAAAVVLCLGTALFNVWLSGRYYRIGYEVSAALEEKQNLRRELDLLKTEILTLRSPARIEAIARADLGMVDPRTDRMIRVK